MTQNPESIAVETRNASVNYGKVCAVESVSLEIARGEIHVLLGRSGSGKTTLLRAIGGFEPLRQGEVRVKSRVVDAATRASWIPPEKRQIGFVFQDYALFPHLSVIENIAYGAPGTKPEKKNAASEWLTRVRLQSHGEKRPADLSGGEQQRVAVARALAQGTDILLFDEPFSNLDAHLRKRVRLETLNLIRENNATAIFVTHDFEEAFAIADRISVLHDARLEQTGTPQEIYETPASIHVARLCGQASFLPVLAVAADTAQTALGEVKIRGAALEGGLVVIRPEDLKAIAASRPQHRILSRRYLGSSEEFEVEAGDAQVLVRQAPGQIPVDATHVELAYTGPFACVKA